MNIDSQPVIWVPFSGSTTFYGLSCTYDHYLTLTLTAFATHLNRSQPSVQQHNVNIVE